MTAPQPPEPTAPRDVVRIAVVAFVLFVTYRLFQPIIASFIWGGLLAIVSAHPYERIVSHLGGRRGLAAAVMGIIFLVALIGPLLFVISEAMSVAPMLADFAEGLSSGEIQRQVESVDDLAPSNSTLAKWLRIAENHLDELIAQIAPHLGGAATWLLARFGDIGRFLFEFLLGCATALFLLFHRFEVRSIMARVLEVIGGSFAVGLMQQTFDTTRGTFLGVLVAAIAQALLAVLALFLAGVPGVLPLGVLAFLLAMVQVGPVIVGAIAAGLLVAQGDTLLAVLMLLWFLVVVASVDNLIRPRFTARSSETPGYLAFLGALSGVISFGLIGVFIGPVLVSLLVRLARSWLHRAPAA
jgi:predicted PurR-regulated permease PerM